MGAHSRPGGLSAGHVRVAALYDVHGNLPALEAVLAEVEREHVDAVVVGGDVVWGPLPSECLERLAQLGDRVRFLRGNADRAVLDAAEPRDEWCSERLTAEQRGTIAGWPETISLTIDGLGETLFCHGSPRSDEEILTAATPEERVRDVLAEVGVPVVVHGHTHHQYQREVDGVRVIGAGSVGLPYEGRPGAYWLLLGGDVSHRRSEYDVEAARARMAAAGFPDVDDLLRSSLLEPVPRDEAIAFYESLVDGA